MPEAPDDDAVQRTIRDMFLDGALPAPPVTAHELRTMADGRWRRRVGLKLPLAMVAAVILIIVLFAATPLRNHGASPSNGTTSTARSGWIAHSAYGIQVSVPRSWTVSYFPGCPAPAYGPGLLTIAPSHAGIGCPGGAHQPSTRVTLDTYAGSVGDVDSRALTINGVPVVAVALGDRSGTQWIIPSAHATLSGTGPGARSVLDTLTRATGHAAVVPGLGTGTETLDTLTSTPVAGPVKVRSLASGRTLVVQALNGQFSFTGPPGRYELTGAAGDAPCAPVSVTLTSGRYATVPPIVCQGE